MTALRTEEDAPRGLVSRAEYYRALAKIDDLQDELAVLRAELDQARGIPHLARIYEVLRGRGMATRALAALYQANGSVLTDAQIGAACGMGKVREDCDVGNMVKTTICHLRTALRKAGAPVCISTVHSVGYYLNSAGIAWVKAKLEGEQ